MRINSKKFFIIGLKRSGTTILKKIAQEHPQVKTVIFEPHYFLTSCYCNHIERYQTTDFFNTRIKCLPKHILNNFRHKEGRVGIKFALHPGYQAMYWKRINKYFSSSPFVFIIRNEDDNYASWVKAFQEQIEGIISKDLFYDLHKYINTSFIDFAKENPKRSCIVKYENLVLDTDNELEKVWKTLKINNRNGNKEYIRKPENWSTGGSNESIT